MSARHARPEPTRERWQPLRAGLVDLFYYDEEEFAFRDGNLLLRGNNGTGKSKVLALLLPFLLDGDVSPYRVEPDGDPAKRMEWNLLLGGRHPHPERTGYSWLELGRLDSESGQPCYLTLGAGLKAAAGKPSVKTWFFTTDRRVGVDLDLVDATRTARSQPRLAEAIGDRGAVYESAGRYRRAVDEALFGLGEARYGALVTLLIQLRQPQLSKRPNEKALSGALTEALPPLRASVLHNIAEAFRALEEDRSELAAFQEAGTAASAFLAHYRRYAAVAARRKARGPREAQYRYEETARSLSTARAEREQAEQAVAGVETELADVEEQTTRTRAEEQALRDSPRMRDAEALRLAADEAGRARGAAERARHGAEASQRMAAERAARARAAATAAEQARSAVTAAAAAAAAAAADARIDAEHGAAVAPLELPDGPPPSAAEAAIGPAQVASRVAADRQGEAVAALTVLQGATRAAERTHREALTNHDELAAQVGEITERHVRGRTEAVLAGEHLVTACRAALTDAVELRLRDGEGVLAVLAEWAALAEGPNPAVLAVQAAARVSVGALAGEDARLLAEQQALVTEREVLASERGALERGVDRTPPTSYTRADAGREVRPGAPLWQVVDFSAAVSPPERAGLEAALEASGLLDAWVTPDGRLLDPGTADVVITAGAAVVPSVAEVLVSAIDRADPRAAALRDDVVAAVLRGIGLNDTRMGDTEMGAATGESWVGLDGRFRIGLLEGGWHKPAAQYVGRGARAAARRLRIAALGEQIAQLDLRHDALGAAREAVAQRRRRLDEEAAGWPDDQPLARAHAVLAALDGERRRGHERLARARAQVLASAESLREAARERDDTATALRLPIDATALAAVGAGVSTYRSATAALWPELRRQATAAESLARAVADEAQARAELSERAAQASDAEREASQTSTRHQILQASVGESVAQLQRSLTAAAQRLGALVDQAKQLADDRVARHGAAQRARGREEILAEQLDAATRMRASAAESFRQFAAAGLLGIALPGLDVAPQDGPGWAPAPIVALARAVERELSEVDDADPTWDRAQKQIYEQVSMLAAALSRYGDSAGATPSDDGLLVSVVFRGQHTGVPELSTALAAEVADRERLLGAREREVLENHLVNEVASELQGLISGAERATEAINAELAQRRMSTGLQLRLAWRAADDGPAGLAQARQRLLRQDADAWSAQDREAVGTFLQAQIARVRARDEGGTWLDHLSDALDYRRWHHFEVQRREDSGWRSAYDRASGGERALAASLPLFAAAASHYSSAPHPHAPRLVMLDEAFAGVDDDARAKCLGLLATFDLDVVMTSEREWGCYPTVPGLAIAQLSRRDGVNAVLVTRWEWDGQARSRADLAPAAVAVAVPDDPRVSNGAPDDGALWP